MTRYYTRTFKAIKDFLQGIEDYYKDHPAPPMDKPTEDQIKLVRAWTRPISDLVGTDADAATDKTFYGLQKALKNERLDLHTTGKARSIRLGLRASEINPRGPYGYVEKHDGNLKKYYQAAKDLGVKTSEILTKIQGSTKKRDEKMLVDLLEALAALLQHHKDKSTVSLEVLIVVTKLVTDLAKHTQTKNFFTGEPDPNSSYWPSSFIASSSSSSSLPPP